MLKSCRLVGSGIQDFSVSPGSESLSLRKILSEPESLSLSLSLTINNIKNLFKESFSIPIIFNDTFHKAP